MVKSQPRNEWRMLDVSLFHAQQPNQMVDLGRRL
jgi:hypothetical protein